MFLQVIRGRTPDPAQLIAQFQRWRDEIAPDADGWLGSTVGVTDDGHLMASARFESDAEARRNSDRPEQTDWWQTTSKLIEYPRFRDCTDVDVYGRGGSDTAGFVQVIEGRLTDVAGFRAEAAKLPHIRADVIGGIVGWVGSHFTEFVYFTTEEEARAAESTPRSQTALEKRWSLTQDLEYFDLRDPWLTSP